MRLKYGSNVANRTFRYFLPHFGHSHGALRGIQAK